MAIARVASQLTGVTWDNAVGGEKVFPGNVTSGNLIVVCVAAWVGASSHPLVAGDVTLKAGSTCTLGTITMDVQTCVQTLTGVYQVVGIYSAPVTGTGSCTITLAGLPSGSYGTIHLQEYSVADVTAGRVAGTPVTASGLVQVDNINNAATGNITTGMAAAIVGVGTDTYALSAAVTQDANFTNIYAEIDGFNHNRGYASDRIVTSDTTDQDTWTGTSDSGVGWVCAISAYKEAGAGSAIKTTQGLAQVSVKTIQGLALSSVKTLQGLQ